MWILVSGDLQRQAGIGKAVHFVEHEHRAPSLAAEEEFGVGERPGTVDGRSQLQ